MPCDPACDHASAPLTRRALNGYCTRSVAATAVKQLGMTKRTKLLVLTGVLGLSFGQNAGACAFHGYVPDPTLVDVLLATEQVVIARLDTTNPVQYAPVRALMGPDALDIPIAIDPTIRIRLSAAPAQRVLLARDGAYGPWLELAVLDDRYRSIIDHVLTQHSAWLLGDDQQRAQYFAGLVNDPNPDVRRLALQELDRAPYQVLKSLDRPIVQHLRQQLQSAPDDLTPIRILLAGLSEDRSYGPILSAGLQSAVSDDVSYLGAYATALIELDGPSAVDSLLDRYLASDTLTLETRQKLLQALAIQHKAAAPVTRRSISRGVAQLMQTSPDLREPIARQFGIRNRWAAAATPSNASD